MALKQGGGHYCPYEQARGCMVVDFGADPARLAQAKPHPSRPPFRVVYPRYRYPREGELRQGTWDPNQRIFEYLKSVPEIQEPPWPSS